MEKRDILVVARLDQLGRDAMDVSGTAANLEEMGMRAHCLALECANLTSSGGKMTMNVINAVARHEQDPLVECTLPGVA